MKALARVHVGCFELFVSEKILGVADLDGKKVGISAVGAPEHLFLSVIVGNVVIDPRAQTDWITSGPVRPKQLFIDGKVDAFLGFPPEPQGTAGQGHEAFPSSARCQYVVARIVKAGHRCRSAAFALVEAPDWIRKPISRREPC
jgi:hypothetical protein